MRNSALMAAGEMRGTSLPFLRSIAPLLILSALFLAAARPALAQFGQSAKDQVFDYNPTDGTDTPQISTGGISVDYDADMVSDNKGGVIMYTKDRWKNWVARSVYILLLDIALLSIIISLPKNEEFYIILAYFLNGASILLSFWVFLCAALLYKLHAAAWVYILPLSAVMAALAAFLLVRILNSDVSLAELKESFQKLNATSNEDKRLASLEGGPGDWPEKDFLQ